VWRGRGALRSLRWAVSPVGVWLAGTALCIAATACADSLARSFADKVDVILITEKKLGAALPRQDSVPGHQSECGLSEVWLMQDRGFTTPRDSEMSTAELVGLAASDDVGQDLDVFDLREAACWVFAGAASLPLSELSTVLAVARELEVGSIGFVVARSLGHADYEVAATIGFPLCDRPATAQLSPSGLTLDGTRTPILSIHASGTVGDLVAAHLAYPGVELSLPQPTDPDPSQ
jgi:hypothetical protein